MQTKRFFQIIVLNITFFTTACAQNYSGKIVDGENETIGFAHVFFQNDQGRGAISRDNGEFSIIVREENKMDTLVFSVLGFETKFIPYVDIGKYKNVINLESSVLSLDEITVTSDSYFRYIIKEAISKIPENYPLEEHLLKGYYQNYTITDSVYSEMIEADFQIISSGYTDEKLEERIYLNQLRKTEDERNLPVSIKKFESGPFRHIFSSNKVIRRTLSRMYGQGKIEPFYAVVSSVDDIRRLTLHSQTMQEGDTILTIRISDSGFDMLVKPVDSKESVHMDEYVFNLISINLTDKAIVKMAFGNNSDQESEFDEVVYRKIDDKYYPSYMRRVSGFDFENKTRVYYTSSCIQYYDLLLGKQDIKAIKKGKRFRKEDELRQIKLKMDASFWDQYPHANQLPATTVLRKNFKKFKSK